MGSRRRWPIEEWVEFLNTPRKFTRFYPDYRAKVFIVHLGQRKLRYPFGLLDPKPSTRDRFVRCYADEQLGEAGLWYVLESGRQGFLSANQVLKFYREPSDVKGHVLWVLTLAAIEHLKPTPLSRRQILKRLHTSSAQLERLVDASNVRKSVDGVLALLEVLGYEVEITVRREVSRRPHQNPAPEKE